MYKDIVVPITFFVHFQEEGFFSENFYIEKIRNMRLTDLVNEGLVNDKLLNATIEREKIVVFNSNQRQLKEKVNLNAWFDVSISFLEKLADQFEKLKKEKEKIMVESVIVCVILYAIFNKLDLAAVYVISIFAIISLYRIYKISRNQKFLIKPYEQHIQLVQEMHDVTGTDKLHAQLYSQRLILLSNTLK